MTGTTVVRIVPGVATTIVRIGVDTVTVGPPRSDAGVGVPVGGTTGQVLAKASNANYDDHWVASSGGVTPFSWSQVSATVWAIVHNLGRHPPAVTVIDGSGNVYLLFDRSDPDLNHTTLTFATAVAGVAYLI